MINFGGYLKIIMIHTAGKRQMPATPMTSVISAKCGWRDSFSDPWINAANKDSEPGRESDGLSDCMSLIF